MQVLGAMDSGTEPNCKNCISAPKPGPPKPSLSLARPERTSPSPPKAWAFVLDVDPMHACTTGLAADAEPMLTEAAATTTAPAMNSFFMSFPISVVLDTLIDVRELRHYRSLVDAEMLEY